MKSRRLRSAEKRLHKLLLDHLRKVVRALRKGLA